MIRANTLSELQSKTTNAMDKLAGQVTGGTLALPDFMTRANEVLDFAHSRAAVLGTFRAKRHNPPTEIAIRVAADASRSQREFLFRFARDVAEGKYLPRRDGGRGATQRKARFALYSLRLAGTANEAWKQTLEQGGDVLEVRWILGSTREHCPDCRAEASIGWRLSETLTRVPGDGSTQCLVRCRCHLETRDGKESYAL